MEGMVKMEDEAIQEEMDSLSENRTWGFVDLPEEGNVVLSKMDLGGRAWCPW